MRTARNARIALLCALALSASPDLAHQALAAAMLADYAETLREDEHAHLRRTALAIVQDHPVLLDDERVANAVALHLANPVLGAMAARALR